MSKFEVGKKYLIRKNTDQNDPGWRKIVVNDSRNQKPYGVVDHSGLTSSRFEDGSFNNFIHNADLTTEEYKGPEKPVDLSKPDEWVYICKMSAGDFGSIRSEREHRISKSKPQFDEIHSKCYRIPLFEEPNDKI